MIYAIHTEKTVAAEKVLFLVKEVSVALSEVTDISDEWDDGDLPEWYDDEWDEDDDEEDDDWGIDIFSLNP